jgi:hypothetical protein
MRARSLLLLSMPFGLHGWIILLPGMKREPMALSTSSKAHCLSQFLSTTLLELTPGDGADQDDSGWGSPPSLEDKTLELRELQNDRNAVSSNFQPSQRRLTPERDRDMFIPIFSLVSLAGLFGTYGYEMLRLYSRGELYLPWDN